MDNARRTMLDLPTSSGWHDIEGRHMRKSNLTTTKSYLKSLLIPNNFLTFWILSDIRSDPG